MANTNGMNTIGSGKMNQSTLTEHLVQEVLLITNDVRTLSLINAGDSIRAFEAILKSDREQVLRILDGLTMNEIENIKNAAIDLAIVCRRKALEKFYVTQTDA